MDDHPLPGLAAEWQRSSRAWAQSVDAHAIASADLVRASHDLADALEAGGGEAQAAMAVRLRKVAAGVERKGRSAADAVLANAEFLRVLDDLGR